MTWLFWFLAFTGLLMACAVVAWLVVSAWEDMRREGRR